MQSLIECSREGLRDGYLMDTGILAETSLSPSLLALSPGTTFRKAESHSNCLHSFLTVSHLSEHDHEPFLRTTRR